MHEMGEANANADDKTKANQKVEKKDRNGLFYKITP